MYNKIILLSVVCWLYPLLNSNAQTKDLTTRAVQLMDSLFLIGVDQQLIPGGAVVLVSPDSVLLCKAYGYANYEDQIKATDTTLFQVGSVGKLFTSIAAMQLVERGLLDLDEDVNNYLVGWKIENPFEKPVTLRNLLTHTGGFNERVIGYQAKTNSEVEPLDQHLKRRMPSLFQEPGLAINYSNYGYALAGYIVQLKSGKPYERYVKEHILVPLGMTRSTFHLPDNYQEINGYANGYRTTQQGFEFLKVYPRNTNPAGGILLTAKDMVSLTQLFLKQDKLLSKESFQKLMEPQFKVHELLTGYGLLMEEQRYNGHQFFSKGGQVQGALAFFLQFPKQNIGLFYVVNTQTDNFSKEAIRKTKELLFNDTLNSSRPKTNFKPSDVNRLKGVYRNGRHNRETIEDFISLFLNPIMISVSENGRLVTFLQGVYQEFDEVDSGVFQGRKNKNTILVFKEFEGKMNVFTDFGVAGVTVPGSGVRVPFYETPSFIDSGYPTLCVPLMVYPVILLWLAIIWMVRRNHPSFLNQKTLSWQNHFPQTIFLLMLVVDVIFFLMPLLKNPFDLFFGLPSALANMKYLHIFMILVGLTIGYRTVVIWRDKKGALISKLYYTLFFLSASFYVWFLYRWHFISMAS